MSHNDLPEPAGDSGIDDPCRLATLIEVEATELMNRCRALAEECAESAEAT